MCEKIQSKIEERYGKEAAEYYRLTYGNEEFFSFDGHNCEDWDENEPCLGWDGESRRCNCGNRRVDWIWENGILWAQAY